MRTYALAAAAAATLAMTAHADITMNIWDDGTDLYMSATGDYDMSNAVSTTNFTGLGANAVAWASTDLYGWETDLDFTGTSASYEATYSGVFTATADSALGATSVSTTNPFFFANFSSEIYFTNTAGLTGSVDEWAVFAGETLASLGMVAGETISVSWGNGGINEGGTINTGPVPAPGALAFFGLAGLAAGRRRRG